MYRNQEHIARNGIMQERMQFKNKKRAYQYEKQFCKIKLPILSASTEEYR